MLFSCIKTHVFILSCDEFSPSWYTLQSIMSRFKVQGFPTIMVFGVDKSSPYAYDGARSASAIESFATELVESSAGPVEVTELTGPVSFSQSYFSFIWYSAPNQDIDICSTVIV